MTGEAIAPYPFNFFSEKYEVAGRRYYLGIVSLGYATCADEDDLSIL